MRVDHALTMLEARVREIHRALQRFQRFPLPEMDEASVEVTRGWVRFDDIRGVAPAAKTPGQQWESDYAKKQREEANAAWRDQLETRAGQAGYGRAGHGRVHAGRQPMTCYVPGAE